MKHISKPVMKLEEEHFKKPKKKHKWKLIEEEKKEDIVKVSLAESGVEGAGKRRREEKPVSGFWAKLTGKEEKPSFKGPLKYRTLADLLEVVE